MSGKPKIICSELWNALGDFLFNRLAFLVICELMIEDWGKCSDVHWEVVADFLLLFSCYFSGSITSRLLSIFKVLMLSWLCIFLFLVLMCELSYIFLKISSCKHWMDNLLLLCETVLFFHLFFNEDLLQFIFPTLRFIDNVSIGSSCDSGDSKED